MINEFYAALLNVTAANIQPGSDYVSPTWRTRHETPASLAVRRALLLQPESRTAANWRSAEIRRILRGCDLQSFMTVFDARTGYVVGDLQREMAAYLRPQVAADTLAEQVKFTGKNIAQTYSVQHWSIQVADGGYQVLTDDTVSTGSLTPGSTKIILPGTDAGCEFPSVDNNIMVTWASRPTATIADTAKQLRTDLVSSIDALVSQSSVYDFHETGALRNVVFFTAESPVQVVAVSLLLAGATLASTPIETMHVNPANASNS